MAGDLGTGSKEVSAAMTCQRLQQFSFVRLKRLVNEVKADLRERMDAGEDITKIMKDTEQELRARKEPLPKNSDHSFFIKQKPPFGGFCGCGIYSCGSPAEKKLVETRRKGTRTLTV